VEGYDAADEEAAALLLHNVLPLEVMQHIMGMLDPASVGRAERVCRAWRVACLSPFVWEIVYRRHFVSRPSSSAQGLYLSASFVCLNPSLTAHTHAQVIGVSFVCVPVACSKGTLGRSSPQYARGTSSGSLARDVLAPRTHAHVSAILCRACLLCTLGGVVGLDSTASWMRSCNARAPM
jgi:hypothetical protein